MSEIKELKDQELKQVNGGGESSNVGIPIGYWDPCHFNPSRWERYSNFTGGGCNNLCCSCVHNLHAKDCWRDSNCEYSK